MAEVYRPPSLGARACPGRTSELIENFAHHPMEIRRTTRQHVAYGHVAFPLATVADCADYDHCAHIFYVAIPLAATVVFWLWA